ncbi:MAG TPA: hypothetical protein VFH19_06575 [Nitrososphaeraceae archaeon]|nr:hypothetical protein [Nitrososphaeraceae archaeon]
MAIFKYTRAFPSFSVDELEKAEYGNTLGIEISESKGARTNWY